MVNYKHWSFTSSFASGWTRWWAVHGVGCAWSSGWAAATPALYQTAFAAGAVSVQHPGSCGCHRKPNGNRLQVWHSVRGSHPEAESGNWAEDQPLQHRHSHSSGKACPARPGWTSLLNSIRQLKTPPGSYHQQTCQKKKEKSVKCGPEMSPDQRRLTRPSLWASCNGCEQSLQKVRFAECHIRGLHSVWPLRRPSGKECCTRCSDLLSAGTGWGSTGLLSSTCPLSDSKRLVLTAGSGWMQMLCWASSPFSVCFRLLLCSSPSCHRGWRAAGRPGRRSACGRMSWGCHRGIICTTFLPRPPLLNEPASKINPSELYTYRSYYYSSLAWLILCTDFFVFSEYILQFRSLLRVATYWFFGSQATPCTNPLWSDRMHMVFPV